MAELNADILVCPQPGCNAHNDQKCIDGLELSRCPNWSKRARPLEESERTALGVHWRSGEAIQFDRRRLVTAAMPSSLVLLFGEPATGKTTLLSALYLAFHSGLIGPFEFAGSETLIGLEKRSFKARIASGGSSADTDHTSASDSRFLHLRVRRKDSPRSSSLLFSDVSGEVLRHLYYSPATAELLPLAQQADSASVLVDAPRLLSVERHKLMASSKQLVRALVENRCRLKRKTIEFVLTQGDKIPLDSPNWRRIDEQLLDLEQTAKSLGLEPSVFRTAARAGPGLRRGSGFADLISAWTATPAGTTRRAAWAGSRAFETFETGADGD